MENKYVLKMEGITKEYFGNKVLKGVELKVRPGEIHALMGENGAGKSTLMNILFGMPVIHSTGGFGGTIEFNGTPVNIENPHKAMELGIGMVHQEFMLIPGFTVAENVKLGREISSKTVASSIFGKSLERLDKPAMAEDTRVALNTIGLGVEDYARVAGMPVGYMQFIEIAREIDKTGIKLLIFDEPTAVLTESEAERLLETMRVIASKGIAIIFITHRINEVIEVTDSMTVLRDGTFVDRLETKDTTAARIAELMIGRQVEKLVDDMEEDTRKISDDDIMLSLKNFYVDMPGEKVKGIDLKLRRGEILGIGGLAGQGKVGIPNGILLDNAMDLVYAAIPAPTKEELKDMLAWAVNDCTGPVAVRYPRGGNCGIEASAWDGVRSVSCHHKGDALTLITYGTVSNNVIAAADQLSRQGIEVTVLRLLKVNPLPIEEIVGQLSADHKIIVVEETCTGSGIREALSWELHRLDPSCRVFGVDLGRDFVPHGSVKELHRSCGLDAAGIAEYTKEVLSQ